jgi:hypothetical protein
VYVSDFGKHQVILHRYMRSSVVLCLDPNYWAVRYLRSPQKRKLAKTGDGEKYQLITEWGLIARNWKASSNQIADITDAPRLAEDARRAALTPKQRRDEDYAGAIAKFQERLSA